MSKIVIIGGGAAGLLCAAKSAEKGNDVVIIEKMNRCGRKLMITGKGRCNVTNASFELDDLISNANAAAFEDPRFYELTLDEFKKVKIEISILSTPVEVIYADIEDLKSKIKANIHGVILQKDGRRSTFLPQVWEQLPTFEEFFSRLCYKGSFEENCLDFHPQIFTYEVNKIKE